MKRFSKRHDKTMIYRVPLNSKTKRIAKSKTKRKGKHKNNFFKCSLFDFLANKDHNIKTKKPVYSAFHESKTISCHLTTFLLFSFLSLIFYQKR